MALFVRSMLLSSLAAALSLPAAAQDVPNLVGTWKGTAYAVHIGSNPYRVAQGKGVNFPTNAVEFTFVIDRQEGNRFSGESSGGKFKETLIGAIRPDNTGGIILDDDGQYLFTLPDSDTMDLCYSHQYPTSKVVTCYAVTRSR